MKFTEIKSCYVGPLISPEQFIAEHFFLYLIKGKIEGYDGNKHYTLLPDECCIVRKNHLARYSKHKENSEFEKVVIIFDEPFLKSFIEKHKVPHINYSSKQAFLSVKKSKHIPAFLQSLHPYYDGDGNIDKKFADLKREELLLILLQLYPEYANIFFDFGKPGKINLEEFMNKNFKFNVSIERFAYLTGRSLSAFKRDFVEIFNETPNRWLVHRRLQEALFLMQKKNQKPSDIYLELGFEDLSHFSFAFKKQFGQTPTKLMETKKTSR
jgi:AraC family transcriptional regulator, exoenzyme S synthesis regulatory protein ExsA